jgi:type III pantothenate kinase
VPRIIGRMLLALDIGNTNITLGRLAADHVLGARRAATHSRATVDELEVTLGELLALDQAALDDVDEIVLASVVPAVTATVTELAARRHIRLLVADSRTIPLPLRVDRPSEVGADRLVNALAAERLYGAPAIVVDFGTATNFDVLAADGAYVGGALAPGLELGLDALATQTAKLPRIELARPARAIGANTVTAMQSGAVIGYIGLVRELLASISAELAVDGGPPPKVILTGGLSAAPWAADIPGVDVIDPELTLRGLAILHAEAGAAARQATRA